MQFGNTVYNIFYKERNKVPTAPTGSRIDMLHHNMNNIKTGSKLLSLKA